MQKEFDRITKILQAEPSALKKFVMVYGNCDLKGNGLGVGADLMEPLLFQVFLKACAELGIRPSQAVVPPTSTADQDAGSEA